MVFTAATICSAVDGHALAVGDRGLLGAAPLLVRREQALGLAGELQRRHVAHAEGAQVLVDSGAAEGLGHLDRADVRRLHDDVGERPDGVLVGHGVDEHVVGELVAVGHLEGRAEAGRALLDGRGRR